MLDHLKRHAVWWLSAFLFALNAFIVRDYFRVEYSYHMDSIEAAYIGLSRYWLEHPFEWGWFREWYAGIPFQNTYPPVLHALVALAAWVLRISPALAHHAVSAAFYCLGPVTLFWLCVRLSNDRAASFLGALAFSLVSPSAPFSEAILAWGGTLRDPARMHAMIAFGDTPHVAALTLIPLALLALHAALERTTVLRVYLAAFALTAVVLTNWLGAFALAVAAACYLLARGGGLRPAAIAAGTGVLAYALASPWIPPSTIGDIQHNAQFTIGSYPITRYHIVYGLALVAAVFALRWVMARLQANLALIFVTLYALVMLVIFTSEQWLGTALMPQPHRYHIEMEMASAAVAGFAAMKIARLRRELLWATIAIAAVGTVAQTQRWFQHARLISGPIAIESTVEYQASKWLDANLGGGRVFISADTAFWLLAFTDTPQLGGGFGQGITNRSIPIIHFGIPYLENEGAKLAQWLRVYGNDAVVVAGPKSRDLYRAVWNGPNKFDGILPELWRDGDDVVYGVPRRSRSLAHVVRAASIPQRVPVNVADTPLIDALDRDLEDPSLPLAPLRWDGPNRATIAANARAGERLYVQVSHHAGWHASAQGRSVPIAEDGLGFMVLDPRCTGACDVTLEFDGGTEAQLARAASFGSLGIGIVVLIWRRRR